MPWSLIKSEMEWEDVVWDAHSVAPHGCSFLCNEILCITLADTRFRKAKPLASLVNSVQIHFPAAILTTAVFAIELERRKRLQLPCMIVYGYVYVYVCVSCVSSCVCVQHNNQRGAICGATQIASCVSLPAREQYLCRLVNI